MDSILVFHLIQTVILTSSAEQVFTPVLNEYKCDSHAIKAGFKTILSSTHENLPRINAILFKALR